MMKSFSRCERRRRPGPHPCSVPTSRRSSTDRKKAQVSHCRNLDVCPGCPVSCSASC
jgi:hypothetical protein